jgi:hypothetical protein
VKSRRTPPVYHNQIRKSIVSQPKEITPDKILDAAYGFARSRTLFSALELGVFTALAKGPLDIDTLMSQLGVHPRAARDFFDALVALGFLNRDERGFYSNQTDTDHYLDRGKASYIGALLDHFSERHYHHWGLLTSALRAGTPQSGALATGSYPALYSNKAIQEIFLNAMTAGSLSSGRTLARKFPWHRYRTVVDVGTAQGCIPVEIARVHTHLTGGGFDLSAVEPIFTAYVERHGLSDRLRFYAGDFFAGPLPQADVLIMGRILHNWDVTKRRSLIVKASQALSPDGALIVYDPMIDDDRRAARSLLSSLNMLLETTGGSEYTAAECKDWMQQAGFCDVRTEPLGGGHTAIIGCKSLPGRDTPFCQPSTHHHDGKLN